MAKLAENDINRILFGYDTEEEMKKSEQAHIRAYRRQKAKDRREEGEYEKWLRNNFGD